MRVGRSWLLVLLILTTHQWHQLFTFIVSSSTVGDFVPLNEHSVQAREKDDLKSAMLSYHEKSNKMEERHEKEREEIATLQRDNITKEERNINKASRASSRLASSRSETHKWHVEDQSQRALKLKNSDSNNINVQPHGSPPYCTTENVQRNASENYLFNEAKAIKNGPLLDTAQQILFFIVRELSHIGAPVTLMFGTLLHEYRSGKRSPCVIPRADDKDFDIAVFEKHFFTILGMRKEIEERFGWHMTMAEKNRLFAFIHPRNQRVGTGFQIDIYGFTCDSEMKLIYFNWEMATFRMRDFLPVQQHKVLPISVTSNSSRDSLALSPSFMVPSNTECVLSSLYGPKYLQPMKKDSYVIERDAHLAANNFTVCLEQSSASDLEENIIYQQQLCQSEGADQIAQKEFWKNFDRYWG